MSDTNDTPQKKVPIQAPILITEPGDTTTKSTTPDFEGGKGYHWMKQVYQARINGASNNLPRKQRASLAERSFFGAVDQRLSRTSSVVSIAFDKNGKRIRE